MPNLVWTYTTLRAALQSWPVSASTAYVADLDNIIGLGELRLVRDLNLELFEIEDASLAMAIGNRLVAKPTANVQVRTAGFISAGRFEELELRSYEWCRLYAPDEAIRGIPLYYAELSTTQIYVVPTPDLAFPMRYRVVARPADSLNSVTPTASSWLSSRVPDALFAACLMEAEHYLKADDRYGDYKTKYYQELIPSAKLELRDSIRKGDYSPLASAAQRN